MDQPTDLEWAWRHLEWTRMGEVEQTIIAAIEEREFFEAQGYVLDHLDEDYGQARQVDS